MKISIITVCYNSSATIADTLASLDAQTWPDKEHWVIDGASSDQTLNILRANSRPWRHVRSERDKGIYDAMNKGIAIATGDVIGTLNSDDFYTSPDALAQVARAFVDPSVDAVWGDLCYVKQSDVGKVLRYWRSTQYRPGLFARGWNPPHPTFFVRRAIYEKCGFFDLSYRMGNDVELMARFLEVHRVRGHYLPKVLVTMRAGGVSNRSIAGVLSQNREILRAFRALGISASPAPFIGHKIMSRFLQFATRPTE